VAAPDRVLELLDSRGRGSSVLRDPFCVDRRVEHRLPGPDANLVRWAPGYMGTVQAAAALLEAIDATVGAPATVATRIRTLAALGAEVVALPLPADGHRSRPAAHTDAAR